ncbi:Hsp20/alpha crystallin family protein [Patescibacteria group bacterium]|nr:Hsp20/alpha crystallin family protein [Patescibacteria group bacterium]MCL5410221.1 Hsp20/alpha crystallin family protein [Patescibacteria group bacterium]
MAIVRWNPWNLSSLLDDDFDVPTLPIFNRLGQGLNIYETEDAITAEAALPGLSEDQIDVTVGDDGVVRISGASKQDEEEKNKRRYFMSSMSQNFNYSFRLPDGVVSDKEPEAVFDNGVLRLKFAKAEQRPPKKITVKVTNKK